MASASSFSQTYCITFQNLIVFITRINQITEIGNITTSKRNIKGFILPFHFEYSHM